MEVVIFAPPFTPGYNVRCRMHDDVGMCVRVLLVEERHDQAYSL